MKLSNYNQVLIKISEVKKTTSSLYLMAENNASKEILIKRFTELLNLVEEICIQAAQMDMPKYTKNFRVAIHVIWNAGDELLKIINTSSLHQIKLDIIDYDILILQLELNASAILKYEETHLSKTG